MGPEIYTLIFYSEKGLELGKLGMGRNIYFNSSSGKRDRTR